ncbi:MAG: ABC transporter substrate-binding protein [Planctomycetota bacterium]
MARFATLRSLAAALALLLLWACSGGDVEPRAESATPRSSARLLPTTAAAAEFLALLVPAERIVALPEQVDDFSSMDFRRDGFEKLPRFARYVAEPLIALRPDLVITHAWQAAETTHVLRQSGLDVLVLDSASSYDDVRATIAKLGERLGVVERARQVSSELDERIARVRVGAAARASWRALVYSNDGSGGWTAGANTTVHALLTMVGVRNAAAEAGLEGHVALDFERVVALAPDVFVVSRPGRGDGDIATIGVLESAGALANLPAIRERRVAVISSALLTADSPTLVDAAELLAREIDRLR